MSGYELFVGNNSAKQARTSESGLEWSQLDGERITHLRLPPMALLEAFHNVVNVLDTYHMTASPAWIECSTPALLTLLVEHYQIKKNERPANWGEKKEES